jgi:hypothetical protein
MTGREGEGAKGGGGEERGRGRLEGGGGGGREERERARLGGRWGRGQKVCNKAGGAAGAASGLGGDANEGQRRAVGVSGCDDERRSHNSRRKARPGGWRDARADGRGPPA